MEGKGHFGNLGADNIRKDLGKIGCDGNWSKVTQDVFQ
jgi:hypothetical protein